MSANPSTQAADDDSGRVVDKFVDFLEQRAGAASELSLGRIRDLAREYANGATPSAPAYDFETVGGKRRDLLGRLVVEKFAHLFVESGGPPLAQGGLSRRVLPGFFMILRLALGEELLNTCQHKCDFIVARLQTEKAEGFGWEDYYADAEAREMLLEILATFASFFGDFEKRSNWFIGIMNSSMAREDSSGGEWQFNKRNFEAMMTSLFREFRDRLHSNEGRADLGAKFGKTTLQRFEAFLDEFTWPEEA